MRLVCYIDGASRGNPGPGGAGVLITNEKGDELLRISRPIGGKVTNNVAEYKALVIALQNAHKLGADEVEIHSDSELLVKQMRGEYKIKNPNLARLAIQSYDLVNKFNRVDFVHILRNHNKIADHLANIGSAVSAGDIKPDQADPDSLI